MVSTPLKNISQNGNLPQIGVNIKKKIFETTIQFSVPYFGIPINLKKQQTQNCSPKSQKDYHPGNQHIPYQPALLKMMFLFQRLDMLLPWRVLGKPPAMCTFDGLSIQDPTYGGAHPIYVPGSHWPPFSIGWLKNHHSCLQNGGAYILHIKMWVKETRRVCYKHLKRNFLQNGLRP